MNKNLFKTYLTYFIVLVLFVGLRIASNYGAFSWIEDAFSRSNVATIVIQAVIMFAVPFCLVMLFFKQKPKQVFKEMGFNKVSIKVILISFLIGFLLFFLNLAVASLFQGILGLFGYNPASSGEGYTYDTFGKFMLGVLFVAVFPAVCEEFTHRGVLMRKIGNNSNYKKAIIISSICFGLMHLNIEQVFYAAILGAIIGFIGSMTDSIYPCMILHFTNNFMSVYFTFARNCNLPGGDFYARLTSIYSNNSLLFSMLFTIFVLVIIIVAICYLVFILFKETRLKKIQESLINVQKEVSGEDIENISTEKLNVDFRDFIMPHLNKKENILDLFLPRSVSINKKDTLLTNIFLIATLFLGTTITIFTLIWGIV